jgi:hypothetical protein
MVFAFHMINFVCVRIFSYRTYSKSLSPTIIDTLMIKIDRNANCKKNVENVIESFKIECMWVGKTF